MRILRLAVVVLVALVVQTTVFADMPAFGARADVVLLVAIAAAMVGGAERGAVVGFVAGMAFDLVHAEPWPLGVSALAYCLAAYLVGWLCGDGRGVVEGRAAQAAVAASGSVVGVMLFGALGMLLNLRGLVGGRLVVAALVVAAVNAVLVGPALRLARWFLPPRSRRSPLDGRLVL